MNLLINMFFLNTNNGLIQWLQNHLLSCPMKKIFGIDCPGCGLQRSIIELMKGNLLKSLQLYPATIPLLCLVLFSIVHLKTDLKLGAQIIKITVGGIAVIILINYIYKVLTHQLI